VEAAAWQLIEKIDAMGGSVPAIEQGFIQDEIARSAYEYQRGIENEQKIIVGVNKFTVTEENNTPILRVDDSIRQVQSERLIHLRSSRDNKKVINCLAAVSDAATEGRNLMPEVIAAVEAKCTLGEISDELRKVFGEYR
ncbi:MAG TPA: methylmalonyl-CoA mutase family protein, partial [Chitinophagaceae bacterium]